MCLFESFRKKFKNCFISMTLSCKFSQTIYSFFENETYTIGSAASQCPREKLTYHFFTLSNFKFENYFWGAKRSFFQPMPGSYPGGSVLDAGGKPSTWFPPGILAEHIWILENAYFAKICVLVSKNIVSCTFRKSRISNMVSVIYLCRCEQRFDLNVFLYFLFLCIPIYTCMFLYIARYMNS